MAVVREELAEQIAAEERRQQIAGGEGAAGEAAQSGVDRRG